MGSDTIYFSLAAAYTLGIGLPGGRQFDWLSAGFACWWFD